MAESLVEEAGPRGAREFLTTLIEIGYDLDLACYGRRNCIKGKTKDPKNFLTAKSVSHRMKGFVENYKCLIEALNQEIIKTNEPHDPVP
ncbi:hypothetical protein [Mucilaginibacter sp. MD40]|uniref:hypothetical protein n=1 Tax=Mucilaginibacter sp. MD40 TaxID=2029590 RepID=UPI000BACE7D9|nr:hypothetical protein [Mucilaginibacter sp. MD40]